MRGISAYVFIDKFLRPSHIFLLVLYLRIMEEANSVNSVKIKWPFKRQCHFPILICWKVTMRKYLNLGITNSYLEFVCLASAYVLKVDHFYVILAMTDAMSLCTTRHLQTWPCALLNPRVSSIINEVSKWQAYMREVWILKA